MTIRYFKKNFRYNDFVLAGDIGGTNINLCIAGVAKKPELLFSMHFKSSELNSIVPAIKEILKYAKEKHNIKVSNSCLAVAGPGSSEFRRPVHIGWNVSAAEIIKKTQLKKVTLINDFDAVAYGINVIDKKDLYIVRNGNVKGTKAVIGAGTGMGKSILKFNGKSYEPIASEGGHADFPAQNKFELKLVEFIKKKQKLHQVSYEKIVSGTGLENIYEFLTKKKAKAKDISKNKDKYSRETMRLFTVFYARCAKNFVLDSLATAGIYIAGGIAAKHKSIFKSKEFIKEFENAHQMEYLLKKVPIYVITNYDISLLGASFVAAKIRNI